MSPFSASLFSAQTKQIQVRAMHANENVCAELRLSAGHCFYTCVLGQA